jgi:tRNA pseudouridine55 synthase
MRNDGKEKKSGYLLCGKKTGFTSFESLGAVKDALGTGKVGHTGTLDKFASGLLIALTGKALKLAPLFTDCDKRYEGIIKFGAETDTLDPEGRITAQADIPSAGAVSDALGLFRGDIQQEPPVYSAIHINGARASELAREGRAVAPPKRAVSIYNLELLSYDPPLAAIRVHCSKGAYIRSLARDIALAAGSRGHLIALNRTHVAGFAVTEAVPLSLEEEKKQKIRDAVRPISEEMFEKLHIPSIIVDGETAEAMIFGKNLNALMENNADAPRHKDGIIGVFSEHNGKEKKFIALIEKIEKIWKYKYVYASN